MRNSAALLVILILTVSSVMMVRPVCSAITKPSIPEFTVNLVDHSYDIPTTYSTDPYTGETVTHPGHRVENKSIEVRIKNQPFASYLDENGSLVGLFYNIRVKGHFEDWTGEPNSENYVYRSDSEYTVKSYTLGENGLEITLGGQVDFQVEALIGYYTRVYGTPVPGIPGSGTSYYDVFTGETSGWSNTQTITVSGNSSTTDSGASPTDGQNPSATPEVPEFLLWIILAILTIAMLAVAAVFRRKSQTKPSTKVAINFNTA